MLNSNCCLPRRCRCEAPAPSCFQTLVIKDIFCSPCIFFYISLSSPVNSALSCICLFSVNFHLFSHVAVCLFRSHRSVRYCMFHIWCVLLLLPLLVPWVFFFFWCIHMLVSFLRLQSTTQRVIWVNLVSVSFMTNLVWDDYRRSCS